VRWPIQRERARRRDENRCQLCATRKPVPYGRLEVHHIAPRSKGGGNQLANLVTLCDLCHAVVHDHMGPAWLGVNSLPAAERERAMKIWKLAQKQFNWFLLLPPKRRRTVQKMIWEDFGLI